MRYVSMVKPRNNKKDALEKMFFVERGSGKSVEENLFHIRMLMLALMHA